MSSDSPTLANGTDFGRYRIVRHIGSGGMGAVYEAVHVDLGKRVAIKTLHAAIAGNAEVRARFLREGQSASRIRHPNVVDVTDVGTHDGVPYMVMEFLEGEDLAHLLAREAPLAPARTAELLLPVIAAVRAAHLQGIVHRDLKPENIFLDHTHGSGTLPKVVDFGISKVAQDAGQPGLTRASALLGTPNYMSPEQASESRNVDARSDQYALGVILYECVTGAQAFSGDSLYEVLHKIVQSQFAPPSQLAPGLPEAFEDIILRAMARRPEDRFPSVQELGEALLPFAPPKHQALWDDTFRAGSATAPTSFGPNVPVGPHTTPVKVPSRPGARTPAAQPPEAPRNPTPARRAASYGTLSRSATQVPAPEPVPARTGPGWIVAVVAAVVLMGIGGGAAAWWLRRSPASAVEPGQVQAATAPSTTIPSAVAPAAPSMPPAVPPSAAAPEAPKFTLRTEPPSASIVLDGQLLGSGHVTHPLPTDGRVHVLEISASGFARERIELTDRPPPELVRLVPERGPRPAARRGGNNGAAPAEPSRESAPAEREAPLPNNAPIL